MADIEPSLLVSANDKLLKALITLLAFKDEHLLDELRIVFAAASQSHSAIGEADAATWAHIRKELTMISSLVESMENSDHPQAAGLNVEVH